MIIALQMLILFRESVLAVLNGWLPPFFRQLVTKLSDNGLVPVEEAIEEQVYADYDEECGVVFFPPVHAQRYAAVCDCLMDERWFGRLAKVLNIGKHYDINFMKYLTEVSGITQILGLDIASSLNCTCDMLDLSFNDYEAWEKPLQITLLQGNAADPDYRLIGCDAVIAVEMIQRLLPHDLDRLVHNVFGFIKPRVAIFTTPNADFNRLLKGLDKNGLRQSDHYFEWTREQLHEWCSNIVDRYPEYMVTSRGVGPGPEGTSHYGCYTQLVLFFSKHYKKEMELNVNSLVLVSNPPEPERMSEFGWITPATALSSRSMLHRLLEDDSTELQSNPQSSESNLSIPESMTVQKVENSVQCDLEAEFGKSFVMFDDDEMYQIRMPRKTTERNVYEIGDTINRLNNTMYDVKNFSKTTQYLIEKNEANSQDLMDEILQLTEKLTVKMNSGVVKESNAWNNINWGENVPYWNQYYKVVGVYNFPCEGKSEDDTILDLLSEEINKLFDAQVQGDQFGVPVDTLMGSVKHITDDVERVIMLMEDNGYELEGDSVVYTGVDISDLSPDDKSETRSDFGSKSNGSSHGKDFNGRVLNQTLGRKVRMLRLMLQHDEEVKQALAQVVCRLKKIAMSSGQDKRGAARSEWLQSKLLDIMTLTEKSILRRKLRKVEKDPLKGLVCGTADTPASRLSKIKDKNDTATKIVEKYESILRMSADNTDDSDRDTDKSFAYWFSGGSGNSSSVDLLTLNNERDNSEVDARETDVLSFSPNEEFTPDIDSVQDWDEKDTSLYQEETNEPKIRKRNNISSRKRTKQIKSCKEPNVKTNTRSRSKRKTSSSNSCIFKKKSKQCTSLITVKRSLKYSSSYKVLERKIETANTHEKAQKFTYDNAYNCIERIGQNMGHTLVLSIPPKPIPDSILELCHPDLHQKTAETAQKTALWEDMVPPVAATEHGQRVDILSQSETVTIALQRMIGTDPVADTELYEREISDLTTLLNGTSSCHIAVPGRAEEAESNKDPHHNANTLAPSIAVTVKKPVVEILTQSGRELIALQRTIGTDPDVDTEVYEKELNNSKLTSYLNEFENFINSEEFFLYDINEPTTSKGLRHVGMDVQCGTDGQISATTSFTFPLRKFGRGIKIEDSFTDIRTVSKTDCVTSTNDILKPCGRVSSPWMRPVGIKIKDSHPQIEGPTDNETNTALGTFTVLNDCVKSSPKVTLAIKTLHHIDKRAIGVNNDTKKSTPSLRRNSPNITKRLPTSRPKSNEVKTQELCSHNPDSSVSRIHVPKAVRSKLSCGGVHVHSYKEQQVSEDVMYQGEWQHHQQKILRTNLLKKPNRPSLDRLKYTRKTSAPQKPLATMQRPKSLITTPIMIRNTKANKMKEAVNKRNLQKKLASATPELPKHKPGMIPKVTPKSIVSYSKPVNEQSKKSIQPPRQTRFAPQTTIINEVKIPNMRKRMYIPPYLHRIPKKQHVPPTRNKSGAKTDSLSNLLNMNNEQITSIGSQSKIEDLVSALLKVSIEPPKNIVNYLVYRNDRDISTCSTTRYAVPGRPSKENILRRKLSNLSQKSSAYSSSNSATTVLNPVVTITKRYQTKRQPMPLKSNLTRKNSESKMLSRMKRLTKMFCKKSRMDVTNVENVPEPSMSSQISSKHSSRVDLTIDGPATNAVTSCEDSNKPGFTKSSPKSSDSKILPVSLNNSKELCDKQDSKTILVPDVYKSKSDMQELESSVSESEDEIKKTDFSNEAYDSMKKLIEGCLLFTDAPIMIENKVSESSDIKGPDENITSVGSETYETGSSFHPTRDDRSLASVTQSFSDFSGKLQLCDKQDSKTILVPDVYKSKSDMQELESSVSKPEDELKKTDFSNEAYDSMKKLIEGCLLFIDAPIMIENKVSESSDIKGPDENITSVESETYETGSSFHRTRDDRSLASVTQSFSDFSGKLQLSPSKISGSLAEYDSWNSSVPACDKGSMESKEATSIAQKSMNVLSSSSVNAESNALPNSQLPDYVNLVDSETGSGAVAPRPTTSEEVLVSGRSSGSYVSCTLDEDATIPSWLYNISQQASGSLASGQHQHDVPEEGPDLEYDVNGNELTVHGAGAGDGYGIHSDQSQDSSGQGTSFSSSATSSGAPSDSIVVDPAAFMAEYEAPSERPNSSNVTAPLLGEESTDTSIAAASAVTNGNKLVVTENVNPPRTPNRVRVPRNLHRVSLPASDADISSIDTDIPSDN